MNIIDRIASPLSIALLGSMLLHKQLPAQTAPLSTRFTITDAGTANKPHVIFIPGLSSSKAVWDAEAKQLAPNFRLHIVQVSGFAGAPAGANAEGPMLPAVVEDLHTYIATGKMRPVVIGHSLGGLLALMLADKHPADVSKLVIVDSLPFYAVILHSNATVDNTREQVKAMSGMLAQLNAEQYAASQTMVAMRLVKNPEAQKLVAAASAASDRNVATKAMVEDMTTDLRPDVSSIKTPTLMLYPFDSTSQGNDPAPVDALYHAQYKAMPNVTLKRIDNSRHFIMYDQPEAMDTAMESFLK